ncbi:MAG: RsmD family RNA methyltransferase [Candidatus Saccharibacteria bacterium]|nr:RsmD family RNA methyltransferase [Candidatus Saccharibacteria bacterium]
MANNKLRIISGSFGSQLIDTPKTSATHPMGERERMAIFNSIREQIPGRRILDAFAGSGAIGIEALSLDASHVDFMENNNKAIKVIKQNLIKLNCADRAGIVRYPDGDYGIIFADPPYDNPQYDVVASLVQHLVPGGIFVLSHPAQPQPPVFNYLELISDKKYAAACIKIYRKK